MRRALALLVLFAACAVSGAGKIDLTLETDGAWVHTFDTDHETAYHASMRALLDLGYTVVRADPIGGSFAAKSPVSEVGWGLWYKLAHVVVEPAAGEPGMRVRLGMVKTRETKGGGREPNNDQAVRDRGEYERVFLKIKEILGA